MRTFYRSLESISHKCSKIICLQQSSIQTLTFSFLDNRLCKRMLTLCLKCKRKAKQFLR